MFPASAEEKLERKLRELNHYIPIVTEKSNNNPSFGDLLDTLYEQKRMIECLLMQIRKGELVERKDGALKPK